MSNVISAERRVLEARLYLLSKLIRSYEGEAYGCSESFLRLTTAGWSMLHLRATVLELEIRLHGELSKQMGD